MVYQMVNMESISFFCSPCTVGIKKTEPFQIQISYNVFLVCNQSLGIWRTMPGTHGGWIHNGTNKIFLCVVPPTWPP